MDESASLSIAPLEPKTYEEYLIESDAHYVHILAKYSAPKAAKPPIEIDSMVILSGKVILL